MAFLLNRWVCLVTLALLGPAADVALCASTIDGANLEAMIEADWVAQEKRLGRTPQTPEAIRDVLARADRLLEDLRRMPHCPDVQVASGTLDRLRPQVDGAESLDDSARLALYRQLRGAARSLALRNPLLAGKPILFLKRRRFIMQMLHEYVGYYYNYGGIAGGGVAILQQPGRSLEVRELIGDSLPEGNYATPALSYDAKTIYFAFAPLSQCDRGHPPIGDWTKLPPADQVPANLNYFSPGRSCFHIFSVDADGNNLQQLTEGPDDDFDPCPLPDGQLAFMSTRRGGFCRCGGSVEPIPTYTLHRMNASGGNIRTLSFHETNEWHPSVLTDGRIVYSRWDYVDRSAAHFHGLWASNPDGSNPRALFGNYTKQISTCFQPRAIPGSDRIVFVAGAHHSPVGGSLVIFDPRRARLDRKTGQDRFDSLEVLTPEVCFPEAAGWPKSYFHSPWPVSENYFLVAFSFDPLPGWGPRVTQETETGIYYFDRFGNLELLYREPGISCVGPIPLAPRRPPPVIPGTCDPRLKDQGEFMLFDVRWSHWPLPENRPIRKLRIFQVFPKTTYVANRPRIGYANEESARMLLGTVPVESDGSAYFRAPAGVPLYFQAVDGAGRAVQSMRSVTYLQPGERRSCVGCHEHPGAPPAAKEVLASRRPPSEILPGPDGTRPFSYPRLIQPVLDRHCVRCHDGTEGSGKSPLVLTGDPVGIFTRSYESLRPYVRWYEYGGNSIEPIITRPGHIGADMSPLRAILADSNHAGQVLLGNEDRRRIYIWLDGNAPFYGTYGEQQQQAQLAGEAVAAPQVQ